MGFLYPSNESYTGSLGITIDSFSITIPNNQLIQPYLQWDKDGLPIRSPDDVELMITTLIGPNTNDTPLLGMTFFQAAYLFVNHDRKQFTPWRAQLTEESNLVSVNSNCSDANSTDYHFPDESDNLSLSSGAIASIVIGALIACAPRCGVLVLLLPETARGEALEGA